MLPRPRAPPPCGAGTPSGIAPAQRGHPLCGQWVLLGIHRDGLGAGEGHRRALCVHLSPPRCLAQVTAGCLLCWAKLMSSLTSRSLKTRLLPLGPLGCFQPRPHLPGCCGEGHPPSQLLPASCLRQWSVHPSTQSPTTANVPFFPCVCANVRTCDHFHTHPAHTVGGPHTWSSRV